MKSLKKRAYFFLIPLLLIPLIVVINFVSTASNKTRQTIQTNAQTATEPTTTVIAKNLEIPWAIDFLPDGRIIFTERTGKIKIANPTDGQVTTIMTVPGVVANAESGLLGLVLHPQFATNKYVYIYYTAGDGNKVVRYTFNNDQLTAPTPIIEGIPSSGYHNGGRIRFGPDGFLYVTTGDATVESNSQDTNSLGGKILRVKDDGTAAPGNPFNNRVYSYGHRNPQGLAWDGTTLYATEHGPSQPSCCDELNRIEMGKNYGWPDVTGDQTKAGTVANLINSGQDGNNTWAPSGTTFYNGSVFWAGLRGEALYEAKVNGNTATIVKQHFKNQFGRIRDVVIGPDNNLYITTSNKSAQGGNAQAEDDKIIKVSFGLAANPTAPYTSPTFNCLGTTCPTNPPAGGTVTVAPTTGTEEPTIGLNDPTTPPGAEEPTQDPCEAETNTVRTQTWDHEGDHKKDSSGDVGNFMDAILEFLKQLIALLEQLLGGGGGSTPTEPSPTSAPEPTTNPCP